MWKSGKYYKCFDMASLVAHLPQTSNSGIGFDKCVQFWLSYWINVYKTLINISIAQNDWFYCDAYTATTTTSNNNFIHLQSRTHVHWYRTIMTIQAVQPMFIDVKMLINGPNNSYFLGCLTTLVDDF